MNVLLEDMLASQRNLQGIHTMDEIEAWIAKITAQTFVKIKKIGLEQCNGWFYDETDGTIHNEKNTFFSVSGIKKGEISQPILIQKEIGYLGILCKKIDGVLHFLMQAKIEPGNINHVQLSPTIQATKSNFTCMHGGRKPTYLEWFLNAKPDNIFVDQIQSEQSSRFEGKRNRNIIVVIDEEDMPADSPNHRWMTLGQIKQLMKKDNAVNMDTRTVLSCIPYSLLENEEGLSLNPMLASVTAKSNMRLIVQTYRHINNIKMFDEAERVHVPLFSLDNWSMKGNEFVCDGKYPFKLIFCDICIDGREVKNWCQPLFEAIGKAEFGLLISADSGKYEFLVHVKEEIGCFDLAEFGPSVQREATANEEDSVEKLFHEKLNSGKGIVFDTVLSEEGGRFYCEQNRNVIIEITKDEIELPPGYFWMDYATLNNLTQVNNCLNIQLRNLLSLLEIK